MEGGIDSLRKLTWMSLQFLELIHQEMAQYAVRLRSWPMSEWLWPELEHKEKPFVSL